MKHLTLAFVMSLSIVLSLPALAQESESVETDVTIRIGGDGSSSVVESKVGSNNGEDFVEFMRGMLGDRVADEIAAEFDQLDAAERAELEERLSDKKFETFSIDTSNLGNAIIIPILAITLLLGMPIIIVLLVLYFSYRKRRQRAELISTFVDAGQDVPPQLLEESSNANPLRSGLTLVMVAAAVSLAFYIIGELEVAALALIPLALGISRLAFYYIDTKSNAS